MIIKLGEAVEISPQSIKPIEKLASDSDLDIENRMAKFAQELKVIAPQAKDFLYFTCVMMHAAEAACINEDGSPKKLASGENVVCSWEPVGEGVKWVCNDPGILPYRNNNRDIFPESELKTAYKNWIGRPLCLDHQSQSVDKIRGVIVDTVYDDQRKRVIALCALDKLNYADLAHKVKSGVANNVSMGTAVGRAVCTDCGAVARTERDFCQHMRGKSCYGEINLDLNPIELSLVVSGADPRAKVKHIIASDVAKAAALLTDYLQLKEAAKEVSTHDLESIKEDLENLTKKMTSLVRGISSDENTNDKESDAVGPTHSTWSMEEDMTPDPSATELNAPSRLPITSELQQAVLGAQTKLASLQENLNRLSTRNEEPTMTTKNAYYQGTEEPKPGQKQYPVDPLNEKARLMDKNLHGPAPFPNVGDVEGSYPGDEQTKKELQRLADEHERAMFREAALKKAKEQLQSKGYFQGTEEPKPGETTYKPDPLNEKARMQDKHMVGQPPFEGVGKVDELYPGDKDTKEKLSRASLRARFEKVAQPDGRIDKSASRWVVLANEKPILAATVDQISKGNSTILYDTIATEKFGKGILHRIQSEGFEATASLLLKNAQPAPAAPPPAEAAPPAPSAPPAPPAPPADEAPPVDDLEPPEDVGGEAGDPAEIVDDLDALLDEMKTKLDDLRGKVSGPINEDAEGLEGVPAAGEDEFPPPPAEGAPPAAPKSASDLQRMRKRVNGMLQEGIDETITALAKHIRELYSARKVYKEAYASMNTESRDYLNNLTVSAVKDARALLADTNKLMEAVVKYAYGAAESEKRAAAEAKMKKTAQPALDIRDILDEIEEERGGFSAEPEGEDEMKGFDTDTPMSVVLDEEGEPAENPGLDFLELGMDEDDEDEDALDVPAKAVNEGPGGELMVDTEKLSSKQERANARVKLAQKGLLGFNELSDQAHPGGSADAVSAANLDVKPSAPDTAFHVYKDLKDIMMELANLPPRVRKQAEMIQQLVSEGRMKPEQVDQLVSHNIDPDAVKYWKAMWGEAKDQQSTEFANKLTQEHSKAKQAEEMESYKGRVKRAYELANQMVVKGFINEAQVDAQVSDIMKYNNEGFESMKKIIAKQPAINKQASIPSVGFMDSGALILPSAQPVEKASGADIKGFFDNYFDKKGLKF